MSDAAAPISAAAIRRGGTMASARVDTAQARRVQALLEAGSYNPYDRAGQWRNDGGTGRAA